MERLNRRLGDAEAELAPPGEVPAIERPGDIERDAVKYSLINWTRLKGERSPVEGIYASKAVGNTLQAKVEREIVEPDGGGSMND